MKLIFLEAFLSRAYQRRAGSAPRFRSNTNVHAAARDKPIPCLRDTKGNIEWLFLGPYVAPGYLIEALQYTQHLPPDEPVGSTFAPSVLENTIEIQNFMDKMRDRLDTMNMHKRTLDTLRDKAVMAMVDEMCSKLGVLPAKPPTAVLEAVSILFDCGTLLVKRLVERIYGTKSKAEEAGAHRDDPKWKTVRLLTMRARTTAYQMDLRARPGGRAVAGKFSTEDVLLPYKGELIYPLKCPVLGMDLDYNIHDSARANNKATVGRIRSDRPYAVGNVRLMSRLAARIIDGKEKPVGLSPEAHALYNKWLGVHEEAPVEDHESYDTDDTWEKEMMAKLAATMPLNAA